jgi:hypothetical protein
MLQGYLRRFLAGPLFWDGGFQNRFALVMIGLFMFMIPSLVGMNLFFIDLFGPHAEVAGWPSAGTTLPLLSLLNDAVTREVVFGLVFCLGLIVILAGAHTDPRFEVVLFFVGMLLVLQSVYFGFLASNRCIVDVPNQSCSNPFYLISILLATLFATSGVFLPLVYCRQAAWFGVLYVPLLVYQSSLWLIELARQSVILVDWEVIRAVFLLVYVLGMILAIAVIGYTRNRRKRPSIGRRF